jgi:hypothetical protein
MPEQIAKNNQKLATQALLQTALLYRRILANLVERCPDQVAAFLFEHQFLIECIE